jgi:hypothetical protein
MAYLIGDKVSSKPSKLLNVTYFFFGYVLALFWLNPISLDYNEKISAVLILGSAIGTFVYYVNPTELVMSFYLRIRKFNIKNFGKFLSPYDKEIKYNKTELLRSPLLKEDLTLITGAFLFAISILLSGRLLEIVGIHVPFYVFILLSLIMFAIGTKETRIFLRRKLDAVMYFYYYRGYENSVADELLASIEKRDWVGADNIVFRAMDKGSMFGQKGGICTNCNGAVRREGPFCSECGVALKVVCGKCGYPVLKEGQTCSPKYCAICGNEIFVP